jgi:hypothetical protein
MENQNEPKRETQMRVSTSIPKLNLLTLTLTAAERWALTKATLLAMKTQDGTYDPEEMNPDDIFQADEYQALITAFESLNPDSYGQTALPRLTSDLPEK